MPALLISTFLALAAPPKPQPVSWMPVLTPAVVVKADQVPPEVPEAASPDPEGPETVPARPQPEPPLRKARILRPRARH
jgi:hypothetical protein